MVVYVKYVYESIIKYIGESVKNKYNTWVLFDKTTDVIGKYVANVVIAFK